MPAAADHAAAAAAQESLEKQALQFCASRVQDRALPMQVRQRIAGPSVLLTAPLLAAVQVIDAEFQYDNRKLTFFFRAERCVRVCVSS